MFHYFSEDVYKFIVDCRTAGDRNELRFVLERFFNEAKKYKCTKTAYKMMRELSTFVMPRPFGRQFRNHEDIVLFNCDSDILFCYAKDNYTEMPRLQFKWTRDETGWTFYEEHPAINERIARNPVLKALQDVSTDRVDVLNDMCDGRMNAYFMFALNYRLAHLWSYSSEEQRKHDPYNLDFLANDFVLIDLVYGHEFQSIINEAYKRKYGVSELRLDNPNHDIVFGQPFASIKELPSRTLDDMFKFNMKNAEQLHKIMD